MNVDHRNMPLPTRITRITGFETWPDHLYRIDDNDLDPIDLDLICAI